MTLEGELAHQASLMPVAPPDGRIEVVVDWKSDVSPTNPLRAKYRTQVRDYLDASGATRGFVVYMTLGQVEEISAG